MASAVVNVSSLVSRESKSVLLAVLNDCVKYGLISANGLEHLSSNLYESVTYLCNTHTTKEDRVKFIGILVNNFKNIELIDILDKSGELREMAKCVSMSEPYSDIIKKYLDMSATRLKIPEDSRAKEMWGMSVTFAKSDGRCGIDSLFTLEEMRRIIVYLNNPNACFELEGMTQSTMESISKQSSILTRATDSLLNRLQGGVFEFHMEYESKNVKNIDIWNNCLKWIRNEYGRIPGVQLSVIDEYRTDDDYDDIEIIENETCGSHKCAKSKKLILFCMSYDRKHLTDAQYSQLQMVVGMSLIYDTKINICFSKEDRDMPCLLVSDDRSFYAHINVIPPNIKPNVMKVIEKSMGDQWSSSMFTGAKRKQANLDSKHVEKMLNGLGFN